MQTQRERLLTVVGEAVEAVVGEVGTTVIRPVYACQPVAWSGQAAPALPVLLTPEELDV